MKKKAWTLSELLISTTIVAIIFVVLTPVITRRFADEIRTGSSQNDTRLFTPDDPDCTSEVNNSLICEFTVPSGVKSINAILTAGGGGGAGATVSSPQQINVPNSNTTVKEIPITTSIKNVVITNISGAGGGGGGGAYKKESGGAPTSQSDCDAYNAKYLTASQNGGKAACVTKYNIGQIPGATNGGIASSVTTVSVNTNCSVNECCWTGNTADPSLCNSSGTSYNGCTRTVCTWYAANSSCSTLAYSGTKAGDWRLPTETELAAWASNLSSINTNKGDNGLRLCDHDSGYGAAQCYDYDGVCDGSGYGWCRPYYVWSSTPNGSYYYNYSLTSGTFNGPDSDNPRNAFSARCVLEGGAETTTVYSGGGGGAGASLVNYTIDQDIINSNIGGVIKLTAGSRGSKGACGSSSGSNGSNGSAGGISKIEIYSKDNVLVWSLQVSGGLAGKRATSSAAGGASGISNTCQKYENGTTTSISCTQGNSGNAGAKAANATSSNTPQGGSGATVSSSINGSYGSGGRGGTITINSSGTPSASTGTNGTNGIAQITYDLVYESAAGGGGGGGALLEIKNIDVTPSTQYTLTVSGGGRGGARGNNGENAGETKVTFGSKTYTLQGGQGGKTGTNVLSALGAIQGIGGTGAAKLSSSDSNISKNEAGKKGGDGTYDSNSPSLGSIGGTGGDSAIGTKGGCGGLLNNGVNCSSDKTNGLSTQFESPGALLNAATSTQYGSAGAGGGGGGWAYNTTTYPTDDPNYGKGGDGQDGYVYIYWTEYN